MHYQVCENQRWAATCSIFSFWNSHCSCDGKQHVLELCLVLDFYRQPTLNKYSLLSAVKGNIFGAIFDSLSNLKENSWLATYGRTNLPSKRFGGSYAINFTAHGH